VTFDVHVSVSYQVPTTPRNDSSRGVHTRPGPVLAGAQNKTITSRTCSLPRIPSVRVAPRRLMQITARKIHEKRTTEQTVVMPSLRC